MKSIVFSIMLAVAVGAFAMSPSAAPVGEPDIQLGQTEHVTEASSIDFAGLRRQARGAMERLSVERAALISATAEI